MKRKNSIAAGGRSGQASEKGLLAALDRLPVAFALFNKGRRLTAWNAPLASLGLFPKSIVKSRTPLAEFQRRDAGLKRRATSPHEVKLPGGQVLRASPRRVPPGQLLVTYEDVSEASRARDEAAAAAERQTASAEILKVIASSPSDVQPVFETIAASARRLLGAWSTLVLRYDGERLHYCANQGGPADSVQFIRKYFPVSPHEDAISGRSVLERAVINTADLHASSDPRLREIARVRGARAVLAVPMLRAGEPIGTISATRAKPGLFKAAEIELLQTFADQAVIAIENVRLFNETKEALERQSATAEILGAISRSPTDVNPVFETILSNATRLCDSPVAAIFRFDGKLLHLVATKNWPADALALLAKRYPMVPNPAQTSGRTILAKSIVRQSDTLADPEYDQAAAAAGGWRRMLGVPMLREGEPIGAFVMAWPEPGDTPERHVHLLKTFADQAVIAIENVRLFNETKEALERQTATAEILKVIASSPSDVQPVFDAIARSALALIGGHSASVARRVADSLHLAAHTATSEAGDEALRSAFPVALTGQGVVGKAVLSGMPAYVSDIETDPTYSASFRQGARARGYRSMLAVPMMREGDSIGGIVVTRAGPGPFTSHQIELLKTFADQAVIAIENVRLFNETKEALERQTATAEILKVISSSPTDVQPVFDAIVASAARLVEPCNAVIVMREGDRIRRKAIAGPRRSEVNLAKLDEENPIAFDPEQTVAAKVILERCPIEVPDTEAPGTLQSTRAAGRSAGHRSITMVPLVREGAGIGALVLTNPRAGFKLTDKQLALVQTFADQAVIAIENVRLFRELEARNRDVTEALEQQTATADILRVISSSPTDTQPVFDAIAASALRLFGGLYVAVVLVRGEQIDIASAEGRPEIVSRVKGAFPIPLDRESITGSVILERTVRNIPDTAAPELPEFARNLAGSAGVSAILGAPMLRESAAIGAIMLFREYSGEFSAKQVSLLETFADQAVIAIENVRLFNETKEALERQTATAEILKVIASSPSDVQPVFDAIVQNALRIVGGYSCVVNRIDGGLVHLAAYTSIHPEADHLLKEFFPIPIDPTNLMGSVVTTKSAQFAADLESEPRTSQHFRDIARVRGYRSILLVPMLRDNAVIGVIAVTRREPGAFLDHYVGLLKTFADQAVIAIENVRLFNETKEALERQTATADILRAISGTPTDTQPVFDAIVQSALKIFASASVGITVAEGESLRVVASGGEVAQIPRGLRVPRSRESATGTAVVENRVVSIPDTEATDAPSQARENGRALGFRAMAISPLQRQDEAIGAVTVLLKNPGGLGGKQLELLKTFADQAVIAIENVRLFNETKEALERQTATAEILRVISSSPTEIQPVLDAVAERAARLCEASDAVIRRVDGNNLRIVAHFGDDPLTVAAHGISRGSVGGRAVLECRTVHVHDLGSAESRAEYAEAPALQYGTGHRTLLAVPLVRDGVATGIILIRRLEARPFSDTQIKLLETFADQAVIAIENVRLFNETKEALERQTATAEILNVIASSPTDTQPVFDTIVASSKRLLGGRSAAVARIVGDQLHLAAFTSTSPEADDELRRSFPRPVTAGFVGIAARERRPVMVTDTESDANTSPEGRELARRRGYRSSLAVPMLRGEQMIGVLNVTRETTGAFTPKELALLQSFASQAVIAIENVRLFNETKESLEQQTAISEVLRAISHSPADVQPVLDAVASRAARICTASEARIFVSEGAEMRVAAEFGEVLPSVRLGEKVPLGRGAVVGRAILERKAVHIDDALGEAGRDFPVTRDNAAKVGYRSILAVPLLREDRSLGGIVLRRQEMRPFGEKQIALLKTFADQAAIAIENVRLFNETKEALERQTATAEILRVISSSPTDVQPVFDAIVTSARQLIGGFSATVTRVIGDSLQLAAFTARDESEVEALRRFYPRPVSGGSQGKAIRTRKPVYISDTETDREISPEGRELARARGYRSLMNVPMIREGVVIGSINVSRREPGPFTDHQISLVRTFADQAVIAIENVRLFNETKEALEQQTATSDVLKAISRSTFDLDSVLNTLLQSASRLCAADRGVMFRPDGEGCYFPAAMYKFEPGSALERALRTAPLRHDRGTVTGRAMIEKRTMHIPDVLADPEYARRDLSSAGDYRTNLAVPMLRGDEVLGCITMARSGEPKPFTDKQIDLVTTFADQAVIAIENVRLFKELEARTAALTKSVGQLTALGEVGQAISSTLDLETVLKTIVHRAVQLTALDGGSIYEYDDRTEEFRLQAGENMEPELVEAVRRTPVRKGEGAIGRSAETREPAQVADILHEGYHSARKDMLVRAGYRAILAVPLLREDHMLGALQVFRRAPGEFAPEVVNLLKTFATQSAMAIQNARLFREIAEKSRQLEVASRHKSDFLASMSHELRTPLNAILGFNEMILGEIYGAVPPDMKDPLADIQASGKHLLRLINNVLDLAKIEAGRMELALSDYSVHDTVESVRSTLRPLAADKGLEFAAEVPQDIPLGYGDAGRITQCLMNLAGNALKFTKEGRVEISVALHGEKLVYRVADTGIGIPPDKLETVFSEFRQSDATIASEYGGTGLGLSISRKFVEMHGGRIWVESELGKGSAFLFEIPLRANPGAAA